MSNFQTLCKRDVDPAQSRPEVVESADRSSAVECDAEHRESVDSTHSQVKGRTLLLFRLDFTLNPINLT